jgi:hypothetical protein
MFSARWPLARRMALWVLDQALPEAPDLTALLRTVFITMAAGAAAGVALIGLFAVGMAGIYQLLMEQGFSSSTSMLSVTGIALLGVFAAYRFVYGRIDDLTNRRSTIAEEADIIGEVRDLATSLALGFIQGLQEKDSPSRKKTDASYEAEFEATDDEQVIHLKRTKK